jgi:hypothetical protein
MNEINIFHYGFTPPLYLSRKYEDSFKLNSDGSFGTYSIKGNQLEICIEGEGCYQFSQHL